MVPFLVLSGLPEILQTMTKRQRWRPSRLWDTLRIPAEAPSWTLSCSDLLVDR